ncbi:MAG: dihydroorotate dehydrogenase-like protein [Armatimonadota bacterium]|jgi:dihydroorotate dehydrogenase (fumarate)
MANISTSFMGINMSSPIVVGASTLSNQTDNIKRAEDAGAGGLVIHSLFQEQIELEAMEIEEELLISSNHFAESLTYFPQMEHAGAREHIMWVERARKEVKFPLFGSLNATTKGKWLEYARLLEEAGCDGLEVNLYSIEPDPAKDPQAIEQESLEIVADVKASVSIPVAVKLSHWHTSVANYAAKVTEAGADGLVMFNKFHQPIIDPEKEELVLDWALSSPEESGIPLRWIGLLSDQLDVDMVANTGIYTAEDVIRQILAGAHATQIVSAVYSHGLEHITALNAAISKWMDKHNYENIEAFRGKLAKHKMSDPYAFERAQYVSWLMQAHDPRAKYGLVHGYYPIEVRPGRVSG